MLTISSLIKGYDWNSLVDSETKVKDINKKALKEYNERDQLLSTKNKLSSGNVLSFQENRLAKDMLNDVIKDICIETIITKRNKETLKLYYLLKTLNNSSENPNEHNDHLNEIQRIFDSNFDPFWKTTHCYMKYAIYSKKNDPELTRLSLYQKKILISKNGYKIMKYRLVDSYKQHKGFDNLFVIREYLNKNSKNFIENLYFYFLLKYNKKLIDKIRYIRLEKLEKHERMENKGVSSSKSNSRRHSLSISGRQVIKHDKDKQKTAPSTPALYTPENLSDMLLDPKQAKRACAYLNEIKKTISEDCLPIFFPNFDDQTEIDLQQAQASIKPPEIKEVNGTVSYVNFYSYFNLSYLHSSHYIPNISHDLKVKYAQDPDKLDTKLRKFALLILQKPYNPLQFEDLIDYVFDQSYSLKSEPRKDTTVYNKDWEKWFRKKVNEEQMLALLDDLNMECITLYLSMDVKDLNKKIEEWKSQKQAELSNNIYIDTLTRSEELEARDTDHSLAELFNQLSNLLVSSILNSENDKGAIRAIENTIYLAEQASLPPNINLHIAHTLFSALESIAVSRLEPILFEKLSKSSKHSLEKLRELFSTQKNFKNYRDFISRSKFPIIPCRSVIAKDFNAAFESELTPTQWLQIRDLVYDFRKMRILLNRSFQKTHASTNIVSSIYSWEGPSLDDLEDNLIGSDTNKQDLIADYFFDLSQSKYPKTPASSISKKSKARSISISTSSSLVRTGASSSNTQSISRSSSSVRTASSTSTASRTSSDLSNKEGVD